MCSESIRSFYRTLSTSVLSSACPASCFRNGQCPWKRVLDVCFWLVQTPHMREVRVFFLRVLPKIMVGSPQPSLSWVAFLCVTNELLFVVGTALSPRVTDALIRPLFRNYSTCRRTRRADGFWKGRLERKTCRGWSSSIKKKK